jgi:hypothetical protein
LEYPVSTDTRADGIAARASEYEAATMDWLERTVQFLMLARDPLYAQLQPERLDGLAAETSINLGGVDEVLVKPVRITVTGQVSVGPAIDGDLGDLEAEVSEIADQRLEQTMRAYFALITEVTRRTGNEVDAHGDAAEGFLAMLEKMDIAFDDSGMPALQMVVSPSDAQRVRAQLAAFTPDQQRRFSEVITRKREAYRASRRRRRLPRHGH